MGPEISAEKPRIEKTFVMRQVEASFCEEGQSIEDLLRVEYCGKKNGAAVLGAAWGVHAQTVTRWVKGFGLPPHPSFMSEEFWADDGLQQRRKTGLTRSWEDKDKKAERVAKIHNETWTKAVKANWNKLSPEEKKSRIRKQVETSQENYRAKMKADLGGDPEQVRRTVSYWLKKTGQLPERTTLERETIESRKSLLQLAKEADLLQYLSQRDRLVIEARYGGGRVVSLEEIGKSLTLTRERVRQIEVRALTALEKML